MGNLAKIKEEILESIRTKERVVKDENLINEISSIAECMIQTLKDGGKILLCGNGGSSSDALHIAGELLGRFQKERRAYAAIALNADVSTMTSIANDYGYELVFARQVEGLMTEKDILIGISASGNSENVILAFEMAHKIGGKTILLTGRDGGKLKGLADLSVIVPSDVTARIQEAHECIYHILCGLVEDSLI